MRVKFWEKKTMDKVKIIEPALTVKMLDVSLKLQSLRMEYNDRYQEKYTATLGYIEYPEARYSDRGLEKEVKLSANSWHELIDKITEHFDVSDQVS